MKKIDSIYLHYLDYELQVLFRLLKQYDYNTVYNGFIMVTKIAWLLCNDKIIVPASNYFESDLGYRILNEIGLGSDETNITCFASSSYNLEELIHKKKLEHGLDISREGFHYSDVINSDGVFLPGKMIKRERSASIDIKNNWMSDKGINCLSNSLYERLAGKISASKLEQTVCDIPHLLGEKAYISRYITPFFNLPNEENILLDNEINRYITREYIRSFLDEYHAYCMTDIPFMDSMCILPQEDEYIQKYLSFKDYAEKLKNSHYKNCQAYNYLKSCDVNEMFKFKNSDCWRRIIEDDGRFMVSMCNNHFLVKGNALEMNLEKDKKYLKERVTIGIITALNDEYAALRLFFEKLDTVFDNNRDKGDRYEIGKIKGYNNKYHYVVLAKSGEGNNKSAIRCSNIVNVFPNISKIIMCGIAAGVPDVHDVEKHVRLGDIVVAKSIIQYDYGKKKYKDGEESFELKSIPLACQNALLKAVDNITIDEINDICHWKELIDKVIIESKKYCRPESDTDKLFGEDGKQIEHPKDDSRDKYPKIHVGAIGSANMVLKDSLLRQKLEDSYDLKAIEMEGSGIADASMDSNVGFIVVRGVCDYADNEKNDLWHKYAAMVAAAYTCCLISYLPVGE